MNKKELLPFLGYGNENTMVLMGSVFYRRNLKDSRKSDPFWKNAKRMIHLFYTKPIKDQKIIITVNEISVEVKSDKNGYFEHILNLEQKISPGFHDVLYTIKDKIPNSATGQCMVINSAANLGIISDIDDTIVKSYAYGNLKKIWTILTRNAKTRKPKSKVAQFYNKLCADRNPIFYVSSSEQNLYNYWMNFFKANGFPIGPLLLRDLKFGLKDFIKSGKGSHEHKYNKIIKLLNFYSNLNFTLIGDNGQKDVEIYHKVIMDFPKRIQKVYIVKVLKKNLDEQIVQDFKSKNIDLVLIDRWNN